MDKTININIAGTLFQIDDEAYRILRDYLQAINNRFRNLEGGHETIDDIESRIAEIFQSQRGLTGAVTKENVLAMISILGKPEDFDQEETETEPPVSTRQRKRMYRNPEDSIISGVCGGIGAYLNTDPVLFRILFVIFAFCGVGFFAYIILWIALPVANTDEKKRELYGNAYHSAKPYNQHNRTNENASPAYNQNYNSTGIGNALNEIFGAIGRVLYVILRIFLIIIGITLVITGFLFLIALIMIAVFKFPGVFSHNGISSNLAYYTDFLNYIVNPASVPWIIALSMIAIILPLLALIYWGVKMIFWFKANDGIISLVGFVIWIISVVALSMFLFNEGISFSETGRSSTQLILPDKPDTLYIITDHKASDLKYDKELSLPENHFTVYMNETTRQLSFPARLHINISDDNSAKLEINKRSSGRSRNVAVTKAESLLYNARISHDTILLDDYYSLPSGTRWTGDFVSGNLIIPENTVLYFDKNYDKLFYQNIVIGKVEYHYISHSDYDEDTNPWELGGKYWILTEDGLKETKRASSKQK